MEPMPKYWDNPVYRFRCYGHGDQLAVWAGHARNEMGRLSIGRWASGHQREACEVKQEAGPKLELNKVMKEWHDARKAEALRNQSRNVPISDR